MYLWIDNFSTNRTCVPTFQPRILENCLATLINIIYEATMALCMDGGKCAEQKVMMNESDGKIVKHNLTIKLCNFLAFSECFHT